MARVDSEPNFLPLTLSSVRAVSGADGVLRCALAANSAAAECWTALVAGCDARGRTALPQRLRALSHVTSSYAGNRWWFGSGSKYRLQVADAEQRIAEAVAERDGADYAEAFVCYDQAIATALVRAHSRLESPTP